jgi:hypothetical protein
VHHAGTLRAIPFCNERNPKTWRTMQLHSPEVALPSAIVSRCIDCGLRRGRSRPGAASLQHYGGGHANDSKRFVGRAANFCRNREQLLKFQCGLERERNSRRQRRGGNDKQRWHIYGTSQLARSTFGFCDSHECRGYNQKFQRTGDRCERCFRFDFSQRGFRRTGRYAGIHLNGEFGRQSGSIRFLCTFRKRVHGSGLRHSGFKRHLCRTRNYSRAADGKSNCDQCG